MFARAIIYAVVGFFLYTETAISDPVSPPEPAIARASDLPANMPFKAAVPPGTSARLSPTSATTQPGAIPSAVSNTRASSTKEEPLAPNYNFVVLQGLNKVTGHVSKLQGPVGTVMNFGTLEIIARKCWKAPPEERPENAALLEVREMKAEEGPKQIFLGWMFSSTPGLSALENPVYDISILSCEALADPEKSEAETPVKTVATDTKTAPKKKHTS